MWAWVAVVLFATLFLYQYLKYHFSGHPLRQLFSPDDTQRFARELPGVSPLVFHPLPKKQQRTRASGTRPAIQACGALSARLFRTGAPDFLETPIRS